MAALIEAQALVKRFGSFDAVRGVDLQIHPGEIVGLLGANGAGKTTLMRCLLGILAPSSGSARHFGSAPSMRTRARLGYVPQGMGLYTDLTVRENAQFVASAYGHGSALPEDDRRISAVPLGQRRQLAFKLAIDHDPEALILDEPTSGVSAVEASRLWQDIGEQAQRGVGVLVTTHNMGEAAQCDRLALMVEGRIEAEGTMAEILAGAEVVAVETDQWQQAFEALRTAGLPVSLAGRSVRVLSNDVHLVAATLGEAAGRITSVPATLDEKMAMLR